MKKLSILLIGLLLVAGLAFAQDEEEDMTAPAVTLSGSASVTFGADLDTGATGFENSISLNAWVVFWDETQGTEEMDGVYGMIELNGFRFRVGDDEGAQTRGSRVTAKIVADPLYVEIYGDGGVGTAYDESVDQANLVGRAAYNAMDLTDVISNDYDAEHMGIAIGADVEIATVEFYVESEYDWKDEDGGDINTANAYAFGLWVSLAPTDELSVFFEPEMA
jgi:hypothetical protein